MDAPSARPAHLQFVAVAVALAALLGVIAFALAGNTASGGPVTEFAGMRMTSTDIDDMTRASMGTRKLSTVPVATPEDRRSDLTFRVVDGVKIFSLTAKPIRWEYRDGQTVTAWGYEGQIPGPTLRVREGDRVRIDVKNELPVGTTVHWHGVDVPFVQDGVPGITQKAIKPGATYSYEFIAKPAGTRWYHSHGAKAGDEARQLDMGLSGPIVIEPRRAEPVDVDQTLVLDEWAIEAGGLNAAMMAGPGHAAHAAGFNVFTINGRAMPDVEPIRIKKGQRVRLRLINAGSSAVHPMHLHGQQVTVTALDGNPVPLASRQQRNVVTLQPGETTDVEFTATNPGVWMLHCHELHHADGGMMTIVQYDGYEPDSAMHATNEGH